MDHNNVRRAVVVGAGVMGHSMAHVFRHHEGRQIRHSPLVKEMADMGHLGAKTSKGIYDYGGRSEAEILKKRDGRRLQLLGCLEEIKAFDPV